MDQSLEGAYRHVMSLGPLSGDATPTRKQHFAESVNRAHQIVGLMHTHLSGIMAVNGIDENEEIVEPEMSFEEKAEVTPEARVDEVWERYNGADPIEANPWVESIMYPRKMTLFEAEQVGFARLLAGYVPAERIEHLQVQLSIHGDYMEMGQRSIALEATDNILVRLRERELLMMCTHTADALQTFVMAFLRSLHAIRFSFEWAQLSIEQKTQVRNDIWGRIDVQSRKTFLNRHAKIVKARNDLKKMFLMFGARVLMDPAWTPNVSYEGGKTGRSVTFPATLKLFLSQVDLNGVDLEESKEALFQLLSLIVNPETLEYVRDFFDSWMTELMRNGE